MAHHIIKMCLDFSFSKYILAWPKHAWGHLCPSTIKILDLSKKAALKPPFSYIFGARYTTKNVSWWSIKSWKTNKYPFECLVRDFQRCRRCVKWGYGLVTAGERKNRVFSSNKAFSLQNHSFSCVAVVNVERREGPKSCGDHSGQTNRWNWDPSVAGKRLNPTLSFWWIGSSD